MGASSSCASGKADAEYDPALARRNRVLENTVQALKQELVEQEVKALRHEIQCGSDKLGASQASRAPDGSCQASEHDVLQLAQNTMDKISLLEKQVSSLKTVWVEQQNDSLVQQVQHNAQHTMDKISLLEKQVSSLKTGLVEQQKSSNEQVQLLRQELQRANGKVANGVVCTNEVKKSPELEAALAAMMNEGSDLTDKATLMSKPLTIVIFGATGDLAKKKLFPALYQLCLMGHIPRNVNIVGYGRSPVDLQKFIEKQCVNIKENKIFSKSNYTARISFHAGGYDDPKSYEKLDAEIKKYEAGEPGNRIYFLSVPPTIFGVVVQCISEKARAVEGGYTRLMIEKPFGRDTKTFAELDKLTANHFKSTQLYRLDHYLGKEVILNISTLRWGNQIFEPVWSAQHIESVQITFKEDLGTGGRGGYFDGFGIIRDIMQNHLLQAFMWLAMEPPSSFSAAAIVKAKVDLLSRVKTLTLDSDKQSAFFAQFTAHGDEKGYLDDETVPTGSVCPTFAAVVLEVDNARWKGVPFLFTAGKGMDERVCELRIRFKKKAINKMMGVDDQNELVLRVQPDEAVYMCTVSKEPGITAEQIRKPVVINLDYSDQFAEAYVGDAYERMFLNTARGDQALFVSAPELVEAWRIFTPLLHQIDEKKPKPVLHPFGILPHGYGDFAASHGVHLKPTWHEYVALNGSNIELMKKVFHELDTDKSGTLEYKEVAKLAKRFFDGREPTESRIAALFRELDTDGNQRISLQELIQGAQKMQRSFEHGDMDAKDTVVEMSVSEADGKLTIENHGAVAEVYLYGATVTKFKTASGKDLIWLSSTAKLDGTKAIRGGIPLVFPQFGAPIKEMAQHGFARNNVWTYVGTKDEPGFAVVVLTLTNEQATHEAWKFPYKLTFTIKVGATKLITEYCVENTGPKAFEFQSLQHTYLDVRDISQTTVMGLKGARFLDKTAADPTALVFETRESADLKEFTDRVYVGKGGVITVQCPTGKILVKGTASRPDLDNMAVTSDTVMWNPWEEKAKGMNDFDDEGYRKMLCIEPGLVNGFQSLPPKASMCLQQSLELVE